MQNERLNILMAGLKAVLEGLVPTRDEITLREVRTGGLDLRDLRGLLPGKEEVEAAAGVGRFFGDLYRGKRS